MKNAVIITLLFFAVLFLTPFAWSLAFPDGKALTPAPKSEAEARESFRLLLTESGSVIEISTVDYLIGCLFAQIPPGYHIEALKSQAIASHTYALRIALNNAGTDNDYDISDSRVSCQPFFTENEAREYYGDEYTLHLGKIREAAEFGANHVLLYENEPIYAVYHSVSAGATNTARYIWDVDFPYLKSVPSDWDRDFLNFTCTNEIPLTTVRDALLSFDPDIIMPLDYSQWFAEYAADNTGYVSAVSARNLTLSGGDIWRILNLRSAAFTIEYNGNVFIVTTKGHGHGVGLSQFGADYMARRGHDAEEILKYYFTDITISEF